MSEIFHGYNTQKNESLNAVVSKYIPKRTHLCRTIVGKGRVFLACGINSDGMESYYKRLYGMLGLLKVPETTRIYFEKFDEYTEKKRVYIQQPATKKIRKHLETNNLSTMIQEDQGARIANTYYFEDNVYSRKRKREDEDDTVPDEDDTVLDNKTQSQQCVVIDTPCCLSCGKTTHRRNTSKLCPKNQKTKVNNKSIRKKCGSCGKSTHQRSSNKLCDNYKK